MECKVKVWNLQSKRSKKKKEDPHALCSVFYFKPKAYYASKSFLYLRGTFLDQKKKTRNFQTIKGRQDKDSCLGSESSYVFGQ